MDRLLPGTTHFTLYPFKADLMFEALTRLFGKTETPADLSDPKLAVAALLVHLAAVDGSMGEDERRAIRGALMDHYDLDEPAVDKLIRDAAQQDADAVDFYKFTSGLTRLEMDDRVEIIRMMWTVVFADRKNHELEDNMVWRIAELIGVSSRDRTILRNQVRGKAAEAEDQ
ncbi:MAG: TerB family tellurite resistance protein [Devosia sp.]|uniref:tellurite resistance TerB family protein n=1 Tax=Devosia sp. TaxID=1871048 RepID=UPI0024CB898E|nr:TerB family tellurite resistance protein [Devosia sp.]UYN98704.1 MAG: TerB family tellurite resistance protein [Devosia sp.]